MRQLSLTRLVRGMHALARQPGWVLVIASGLAVAGGLMAYGTANTDDGLSNAALNVGTSMLGAMITVAIIAPIIRYVQEGTVREHRRLDYGWFIDQVGTADQTVQVLTTFTNALENATVDRFFRAMRAALGRDAKVRILLLNPRSLAVDVRQQELDGGNVRLSVQREILLNLRRLSRFVADLGDREREGFEVRLYDASASITLYRWDDRALVSFLPIGRFSEFGGQLEVSMRSPLGEFIQERFDDLWADRATVTMADFMDLTVTLVEDEQTARQLQARYVEYDGGWFVIHTEILAAMARRPARLQVFLRGDPAKLHDLYIVDSQEPRLHEALQLAFVEKYDVRAHAFVGLRPAPG